jgi:hypothetical protein
MLLNPTPGSSQRSGAVDIESARRSFFVGDRGRRYLTGGGRAATSNAERPTPNIEHRSVCPPPKPISLRLR